MSQVTRKARKNSFGQGALGAEGTPQLPQESKKLHLCFGSGFPDSFSTAAWKEDPSVFTTKTLSSSPQMPRASLKSPSWHQV